MGKNPSKTRGLGRGLSALMADVAPTPTSDDAPRVQAELTVPIEQLKPNPDQPRRQFNEEDLADLTSSIEQKGVIQPLIVRKLSDATYEIVAGERRWRAAQRAKLHELPVLVRDFTDTEVLEVAIIENIQRADLNAVEEAAGYRQLMDRFGHTQEKMAEALGKSRSHIANLLRLLSLPEDVQNLVRDGDLSSGHARALITSENPSVLAKTVVAGGLSVRATEDLVRKAAEPKDKPKPTARRAPEKDADTRALEGDLSATLRMKVSLNHRPGGEGGTMTITYKSLEDLDTLCQMLGGH